MRSDPETAIHGLYAAWRLEDVEGTLAYCSDDICYELNVPPELSRFSGVLDGKQKVREYLSAVVAAWEFLSLEHGVMTVHGGLIRELTTFRSRFRATGDVLESTKRHVWHIEDGQVTRCVEFQDTPLFQAFFSQTALEHEPLLLRIRGLTLAASFERQ